MQAGFYGIQAHHTQAHLLQATYESVLFSLMHHLNRMLQRFPNTQILRITGGPTKSPIWLQMLADLTGMTLEVPNIEETGCLGAAMMAMEAKGETPPELLQQAMRQVKPNPDHFEAYQKKYQRYQRLISALKTLH